MSRILVADDDAAQLDLRCRLLETGGHRAIPAFSASETMRQLSSADVVVMDLRLPQTADGLALIRGIRAARARVPIILLTGWPADLEDRPEAELVSRIMPKPVRLESLLQAVAEVSAA